MSAAEWLESASPSELLQALRGRAGGRKLLLFGCACCRRVLTGAADPLVPAALAVAEAYADGTAGEAERRSAFDAVLAGMGGVRLGDTGGRTQFIIPGGTASPLLAAAVLVLPEGVELVNGRTGRFMAGGDAASRAARVARQCKWQARANAAAAQAAGPDRGGPFGRLGAAVRRGLGLGGPDAGEAESAAQEALLRDAFGDPFHPSALDASWHTPTVLGLARAAYELRAFDRLPVLADALEDAGCVDEALLGHCRGPGPHVRGCWAVDLVLGKS